MSGANALATIKQQADFLDYLIERCIVKSEPGAGSIAEATRMTLSADDVAMMCAMAHRLHRMAPHEAAIKRLVVSK